MSFEQSRHPTGGANPFAVVAADMNNDGMLDLAVTHVGSHDVIILLATGPATYRPTYRFAAGRVPRGIVATDLNADGLADLVVAGGQKNTVEVLIGDGKGSGARATYRAGIAPFNLAVADLSSDGNLDIAVANESNLEVLRDQGEISILTGDGKGRFVRRSKLQSGTNPADIKAADLDGDGRSDLAVLNWASCDLALFYAKPDGSFSDATKIRYGRTSAYSLDVADLDGDRVVDIVVGDASGAIHVFRNDGAGRMTPAEVLQAGRGLRSLTVADLNGDGRNDLATANASEDDVTVILGRQGGFAKPYDVPVGHHPRTVAAADLNGDGRMDLVVTNIESGDLSVLLNR